MKNGTPLALDVICRVLEIPRADVTDLAALKTLARTQRRTLALRHHPDQGGDPTRMQEINRVADHVESATRLVLDSRAELLNSVARQWAAAQGFGFTDLAGQYQAAQRQYQADTENGATSNFTFTWPPL